MLNFIESNKDSYCNDKILKTQKHVRQVTKRHDSLTQTSLPI